jgi:hypothetical protein
MIGLCDVGFKVGDLPFKDDGGVGDFLRGQQDER